MLHRIPVKEAKEPILNGIVNSLKALSPSLHASSSAPSGCTMLAM
jgi:hypothetical protein